MKDLKNNINVEKLVAPATISGNGTSVSGIIDLKNYNAACIVLYSGAWTDGTYTVTVAHGDAADLSDTADAAADLLKDANNGAIAAANKYARIGYIGVKRYIRVTITASGVSSGAVVGAMLVEGRPLNPPVA